MSCYTRSSVNYARTRDEIHQLDSDISTYRKEQLDEFKEKRTRVKHVGALLLDSSLITTYNQKTYQYKIIECGDYFYIYNFNVKKQKKDSNLDKMKDIAKVDIDKLFKQDTEIEKSRGDPKKIEYKNILRSKFQMQRLVKSNEKIFKTFITLTFKENLTNIQEANKKFNWWISNIRKKKKDFAYIAVPEFQKRGAVHYHLLTNLDIKQNHDIIISQEFKKNQYDVIYWPHGFTSVFDLKDMNVVGYLTKYMTKDIDNRLWGHRRYLCSMNLKRPSTLFLNPNEIEDLSIIFDIMSQCDIQFSNSYFDSFGNEIAFREYKKKGIN